MFYSCFDLIMLLMIWYASRLQLTLCIHSFILVLWHSYLMPFSSNSNSVFGWSQMLVDGKYGKKRWREKICFPLFVFNEKKKFGLGCFPPGPIKTNSTNPEKKKRKMGPLSKKIYLPFQLYTDSFLVSIPFFPLSFLFTKRW